MEARGKENCYQNFIRSLIFLTVMKCQLRSAKAGATEEAGACMTSMLGKIGVLLTVGFSTTEASLPEISETEMHARRMKRSRIVAQNEWQAIVIDLSCRITAMRSGLIRLMCVGPSAEVWSKNGYLSYELKGGNVEFG